MKENIKQHLDLILDDINFFNNPYFENLHNGSFEKIDFIETQIQVYYVIHSFPKILADLITKLPEGSAKMNIVQNLYEEHGEGISLDTKSTFRSFLNNLGMPNEEINKRALWPESHQFILTAHGVSFFENYKTTCGFLGAIEYMFLTIAKETEMGILRQYWLAKDKMLYYKAHEEMDMRHSDEFFALVENRWDKSEIDKFKILQGMRLGSFALNELYRHLYENRINRLFRVTV